MARDGSMLARGISRSALQKYVSRSTASLATCTSAKCSSDFSSRQTGRSFVENPCLPSTFPASQIYMNFNATLDDLHDVGVALHNLL